MNIVFLSFYSGFAERGVENWVYEVGQRLSEKHYVTIFQAGDLIKTPIFKKISIKINWNHLDTSGNPARKLYFDYWSRKIANFTKDVLKTEEIKKADIIIPLNGGWQSVFCKIFSMLANKKIIFIGHSGLGYDDYININIRPNLFVALTDFQKNWALKINKNLSIVKIPDGVDLKKFSQFGKKKETNLKPPIILLVSALTDSKNIDKTINAVARLKDVNLIIMGKGDADQTEKIKLLCEKALKGRYLLGNSQYSDIAAWYRTADLVTASFNASEAFGMVLLEAMACNKPVIIANDPIRKEIVGDGGLYFKANDIDDYTKVLREGLNNNFADRPRKQADKFSWDKIVVQYEKVFRKI